MLPVVFLILAGIISSRHNLPFAKGAKITGFMYLIGLLIGIVVIVLGVVAFAVITATGI